MSFPALVHTRDIKLSALTECLTKHLNQASNISRCICGQCVAAFLDMDTRIPGLKAPHIRFLHMDTDFSTTLELWQSDMDNLSLHM